MNILRILVVSVMIILTRQEKVKHKQKQYFERYIITRLTLLEETIFHQENEIQQLKESNNQLKTTIKNANDTLKTPQNQDEPVVQQREEILQLKHSIEQLKMDMMILNGSLEILLNQQRDEILQINNNEDDLKALNESLNILHDKVQILSGQADQGNPSKKAPSMENEREHPMPSTTSTILTTVTNNTLNSKILQTSVSTTLVPPTFTVPVSGNKGKEFITMFPNAIRHVQNVHNQFLISSEKPGWAIIKIPAAGIEDNVTLDKGSTYWDVSKVAGFGSNRGILEKVIYVKSSIQIALYAMTLELDHRLTPYITPIFALQNLGTEYIYESTGKICLISTRNLTKISVKFGTIALDYLSHVILPYNSLNGNKLSSNFPIVVIGISSGFRQFLPSRDLGKIFIIPEFESGILSFVVTPLNAFTSVSKFDGTFSRSNVISGPTRDSVFHFGFITANDTIMISLSLLRSDKYLIIPPVSSYAYIHSCPCPHLYRYSHVVMILVPSNTIQGIKVNDHVITSDDVQKTTTQSVYTAIQILYNIQTEPYVNVVSENVKVAVFIIGHSNDRYQYIYNCVP